MRPVVHARIRRIRRIPTHPLNKKVPPPTSIRKVKNAMTPPTPIAPRPMMPRAMSRAQPVISQPRPAPTPTPAPAPTPTPAPTPRQDVHVFDGKLVPIPIFLPEQKRSVATPNALRLLSCQLLTNAARLAFDTIVAGTGNHDSKNNYNAYELLVAVAHLFCLLPDGDKNAHLKMIDEQLSDMQTSGMCPQGRCTRLYQVYTALQNI